MKGKNGVKLADFIREIINTKISEKPVKSRVSGVFSFLRRNSKNEKITNFHNRSTNLFVIIDNKNERCIILLSNFNNLVKGAVHGNARN